VTLGLRGRTVIIDFDLTAWSPTRRSKRLPVNRCPVPNATCFEQRFEKEADHEKQWTLIANASVARLFSRESDSDPLLPLHSFEHPESRLKASELADDRLVHDSRGSPAATSAASRCTPRTPFWAR